MIDDPLTPLTTLSPGWDGHHAPPPDEIAIAAARAFLEALGRLLPGRAPRVAPRVVGGLTVTVRGIDRNRVAVAEFLNDGTATVLFSDGLTEPSGRMLGEGESFAGLVGEIGAYLGLETEARTDG